MKQALFLFIFLAGLTLQARAQTGSITGQVLTEKAQPAEFVNVLLQHPADSTLVQADLTTAAGRYNFTGLAPGTYRVAVVGLGYKKAYSELLTVAATAVEAPAIGLQTGAQNLSEVTVTARRPFLEQQPDKLVVNVAGSIVAAGSTAMEVLRKVPGVQVRNERVTLAGKASVSIMIDGRPSPYTDMNALIRDMPSGSIDRIEVISNPSAKYDAAGGAVINIIMKTNVNLGTNAAVALSLGDGRYDQREVGRGTLNYFRVNPTLSANHRQGHWNVFGSYGLLRRNKFDNTLLNRYVAGTHYVQRNYNPEQYTMHTYRAGVDYTLSKKNTFGILIQG
ncbi:TonB-dependent receptor, partial [Hymenobacter terrenus]|uniref:TonB-dependent receptor n=1 Tax=Hymenobacter terrenus TaxID=1629124 RepID=UPI000619902C